MEIKKDYFPKAKAPDIAKKIVMQYVYWNKKNLSKRFYFYRIYAPAFVLLFIMIWWLAVYTRELRPLDTKQNGDMSDKRQQLIAENPASRNFVSNTVDSSQNDVEGQNTENTTNIPTTNNIDQTNNTTKTLSLDNSLVEAKINNPSIATVNGAVDLPSQINATNVSNPVDPQVALAQQISEINNLINDITSITSQEEKLF